MEIISTQGDGLCPLSSSRPVIIAIGVFDGVHLGHQRVILHTIECARSIGGIAAVYTFSPHPTSIVGTAKALIFPLEIKYKRIAALGIDVLVEQRFDTSFAQLRGKEFIKLLQKKIPTLRGICVGEDFRFGCTRSGDTRLLGLLAKEVHIETHILPSLCSRDEFRISSTRIRRSISGGSMELANDLLGVPYEMEGTLLHDDPTGVYLGSAQLQLNWEPELKPCSGLYYVRFENKRTGDPVSQVGEGILYYPCECAASKVSCQIRPLGDVVLSPGDQIRMNCLHFSHRLEWDMTKGVKEIFIEQEKKAAQEYFLQQFSHGH